MTPLDCAILGVLQERPRTGYAVRKAFSETAMGNYSSSPGSIYPALARLTKQGLIESVSEATRSTRPKPFFQLTKKGKTKFNAWLSSGITRHDVTHGMHILLLKFAFMDARPVAETIEFLQALESEVRSYVSELEAYRTSQTDIMRAVPLLAIDNGIAGYKAQALWAANAAKSLGGKSK